MRIEYLIFSLPTYDPTSKITLMNHFSEILIVRIIIVSPFITFVLIISFLYVHILVHMGKVSKDPLLRNSQSGRQKRASNRRLHVTIFLLAGSAIIGKLLSFFQY